MDKSNTRDFGGVTFYFLFFIEASVAHLLDPMTPSPGRQVTMPTGLRKSLIFSLTHKVVLAQLLMLLIHK